jgi:hypothetical protein
VTEQEQKLRSLLKELDQRKAKGFATQHVVKNTGLAETEARSLLFAIADRGELTHQLAVWCPNPECARTNHRVASLDELPAELRCPHCGWQYAHEDAGVWDIWTTTPLFREVPAAETKIETGDRTRPSGLADGSARRLELSAE